MPILLIIVISVLEIAVLLPEPISTLPVSVLCIDAFSFISPYMISAISALAIKVAFSFANCKSGLVDVPAP